VNLLVVNVSDEVTKGNQRRGQLPILPMKKKVARMETGMITRPRTTCRWSQRQTRSKAAGRRRGPASKSRKVAINEDKDNEDEDNEPLGSLAAASTKSRRCTRSTKTSTRHKFKSKEVILADEDMDNKAV
jgi:hypothetical protein